MFAAFKIIGTILLACASVFAAIVQSGHPLLFGCLCGAFVAGIVGAEASHWYRNNSVRSGLSK